MKLLTVMQQLSVQKTQRYYRLHLLSFDPITAEIQPSKSNHLYYARRSYFAPTKIHQIKTFNREFMVEASGTAPESVNAYFIARLLP